MSDRCPSTPGREPRPGGPFSVVIKPIGAKCNLKCRYCYYLEKERLYAQTRRFRMSDGLLEVFIRDYIKAHREASEVTFMWQGGEPTLLGRAFFRKALAYQRRHCPPGLKVSNALQTNGTLLNERWAVFLRDHDFLVGLSIDGPRRLHDQYRETRKKTPTFDAVRRALRLLRREQVALAVLGDSPLVLFSDDRADPFVTPQHNTLLCDTDVTTIRERIDRIRMSR